MKKYSKKRGPVRAKKVSFDGIQFQSGLEVYMYKALKEASIVAEYEPTSYTLLEGFDLEGICYKIDFTGNKVLFRGYMVTSDGLQFEEFQLLMGSFLKRLSNRKNRGTVVTKVCFVDCNFNEFQISATKDIAKKYKHAVEVIF